MAISQSETMDRIAKALKTTINKFRENPYYFFTESDIVSYMWKELYSTKLDMGKTRSDGKRIYLVHREYPTNFRYRKADLGLEKQTQSGEGSRGHYDLVVLNPEFVERHSADHVVNKTFALSEERACKQGYFKDEILVAMEFKYVIGNSSAFVKQVKQDNHKLIKGLERGGVMNAVNLVFCNLELNADRKEALIGAVTKPPKCDPETTPQKGVQALFVESYYDGDTKILKPVIPSVEEVCAKLLSQVGKANA